MAFSNDSLDTKLKFDLDTNQYSVYDNTTYTEIGIANVVGVYALTDPNENPLHVQPSFSSPDITPNVDRESDGESFTEVEGDYTLVYSVYDSNTDTTYTKTFTFTYAASVIPTVVIGVESDVATAVITSTDATTYEVTGCSISLDTRIHSLTWPDGITIVTSTGVEPENDSISSTDLWTGEYITEVTSNITITKLDNLIINRTITGEDAHNVWDSDGVYAVREALDTFYNRWNDAQTANPGQARKYAVVWNEINSNYTMFNSHKQNGDIVNSGKYLNNIKELLNAEGIDTTIDPSVSVPVTAVLPGYATQWLDGDGIPASTLGRNGDYYFRTDTAGVYNKVSGNWEFVSVAERTAVVDGITLEINGSDEFQVKDDGITGAKLHPDVAGDGIKQDASGNLNIEPNDFAGDGLSDDGSDNLKVNVDDSTLEISTDILRIKDSGVVTDKLNNLAVTTDKLNTDAVTKEKINSDVAGSGIGQNVDGSLEVNVDDSTIEINTDTLRVKDDGITGAKLNANVVDDSTLEQTGTTLNVKDDGITGAKLNANTYDNISIGKNGSNKLYSKQNTYVAYAYDVTGVGFTETFSTDMDYIAILQTSTPIETLTASDFDGLWFRIDKYGNAFSYDNINYYDTDEKGMGWSSNFIYSAMSPNAYYHEGDHKRVYFAYFEGRLDSAGDVRSGREARSWLNYYDVEDKMFADEVTFTELHPDSNDNHNLPVVIVSDLGYVIFVKEQLDSSGNHNSPLEVWRSDSPEDISSFTKVTELNYQLAYPQLFKDTDGTLFIYCRERIGGEERYNAIFKSEDDGATWRSISGVANTKTQVLNYDTAGLFAYPRTVIAAESQGINIILNPNIYGGSSESVHFLHSDDGRNWENVRQFVEGSGGYTYDVVSSGALTRTLLDTNYLVDGPISDPMNYGLGSVNGCVDPDKIPYILSSYYPASIPRINRNINLYLNYYSTSTHAWVKKDILPKLVESHSAHGYPATTNPKIIAYGNGKIDVITPFTKEIGDLLTQDEVISSGSLIAGVNYRIITTSGSLKTGLVAGDIFKSDGTESPDGSNTVVPMRITYMVFRSVNYGDSFTYIDLDSKYAGTGGAGAMMINYNCIDKKQLFFGYQTSETTDYSAVTPLVEYSNLVLFNSKID